MGTTIIGVTYNGGVILGADSRNSTGLYVANRASDKITQLTDNVYICRLDPICLCTVDKKPRLQILKLSRITSDTFFISTRSGSSYLYGFFDQAWKDNMTKEEAEQLVVKAVPLAIARDGASGGVVRTVIINSEGVTRNFYPGDKLPLWHDEVEAHDSLLDILNASEPMNV
ncbi:hypothetical protein CTI12_AA183590 [Artemisia annua]|uniref:Uncharacterized protein n=1 Tax=Artemisia annua TaxID=35608 RepID=A0A2U1P7Y0_ARTAN|nr:hypothetical protein CTI12_AA183590 [Artemisia annua]